MTRRKDGRWQTVMTIGGKKRYFYSSADTEKAAERDIKRQLAEFRADEEKSQGFSRTADEWAAEHFETLENNSLKSYRPALKDAKEYFGDEPLSDISAKDIEGYVNTLKKKNYAKKTVKMRLLVVNLIFKWAIINNRCAVNPCFNITLPKNLSQTKREGISEDDMRKINENVSTSDDCLFAAFVLNTGLRRGEALALDDQDIKDGKVRVNKTLEWIGNVPQLKTHPKTDAGNRDVPLPDFIAAALKGRKGILFPGIDGYMHNAAVTRMVERYQKQIDVSATPHQLRHGYATILYNAGVDVKTAQRWMGHANIQTTLDIYTHLSEEHEEDQTEKLLTFITQSVSKKCQKPNEA